MFPEGFAVIRRDHDHCVIVGIMFTKIAQDLTDPVVGIPYAGIVKKEIALLQLLKEQF